LAKEADATTPCFDFGDFVVFDFGDGGGLVSFTSIPDRCANIFAKDADATTPCCFDFGFSSILERCANILAKEADATTPCFDFGDFVVFDFGDGGGLVSFTSIPDRCANIFAKEADATTPCFDFGLLLASSIPERCANILAKEADATTPCFDCFGNATGDGLFLSEAVRCFIRSATEVVCCCC